MIYDRSGRLVLSQDGNLSDYSSNKPVYKDAMYFVNGADESVEYTYDASGRKLSTRYETEIGQSLAGSGSLLPGGSLSISVKNKTDYCGNFIYQNDTLSKILTPEGYLSIVGSVFNPYYVLLDYQGNARVVMDQSCTVKQVNHSIEKIPLL